MLASSLGFVVNIQRRHVCAVFMVSQLILRVWTGHPKPIYGYLHHILPLRSDGLKNDTSQLRHLGDKLTCFEGKPASDFKIAYEVGDHLHHHFLSSHPTYKQEGKGETERIAVVLLY